MSVSVSMPQLGESVTEGTVTRWLKKEGERVQVDEPLLEVSTDKVDTEIPSPASGILRSIAVDEDETVEIGAQLAVIEEEDEAAGSAPAGAPSAQPTQAAQPETTTPAGQAAQAWPEPAAPPAQAAAPEPEPATAGAGSPVGGAASPDGWTSQPQPSYAPPGQASGFAPPPLPYGQLAPPPQPAQEPPPASAAAPEYPPPTPLPTGGETPYVTPLVRKLAAEHAVDLETVTGTGVGGRVRKQDVVEAARVRRAAQPQAAPEEPARPIPVEPATRPAQPPLPAQAAEPAPVPPAAPQQPVFPAAAPQQPVFPPAAPPRPALVPSALRGTTQRMSRPRQVIAQRMVESLRVSAQLTTVSEVDVTAIARLRDRARADFEAREGVKLTFLPFFALAAVEALKVHPRLNAVLDGDQVTYHDAEHLGIAVDTERGLMVPVIHDAGDLNIGGLARKISDLAQRTRSGQVGPDELVGGTFTLTNTGSRGALFDTPIINQPQVAILGTGTVVKRPVVVDDPALGEVIAVRSMTYLALTYDHRLVDGADAARYLATVKTRLEEGAFEAELGL